MKDCLTCKYKYLLFFKDDIDVRVLCLLNGFALFDVECVKCIIVKIAII